MQILITILIALVLFLGGIKLTRASGNGSWVLDHRHSGYSGYIIPMYGYTPGDTPVKVIPMYGYTPGDTPVKVIPMYGYTPGDTPVEVIPMYGCIIPQPISIGDRMYPIISTDEFKQPDAITNTGSKELSSVDPSYRIILPGPGVGKNWEINPFKAPELFIPFSGNRTVDEMIKLCDGWGIDVNVGIKYGIVCLDSKGVPFLNERNFSNYPDIFRPTDIRLDDLLKR